MRSHIITLLVLLALTTIPARADQGESLCDAWESRIAEDMRILESDLTYDKAQKALETLRDSKPDSGDMEFGHRNSTKIDQGYALRQVALSTRSPNAIAKFCGWLVKEGFWYD